MAPGARVDRRALPLTEAERYAAAVYAKTRYRHVHHQARANKRRRLKLTRSAAYPHQHVFCRAYMMHALISRVGLRQSAHVRKRQDAGLQLDKETVVFFER